MKQKLLWLVFALVTAAQGASLDAETHYPPELKPAQQDAQAAHLAAELLARYHYKRVPLDDTLSAKIFDQYLKSLDSEKLFFVQSDIDRLSVNRTKLDDAILKEDLTAPFAIFNLYDRRATERFAYARTLLKKGFDFQQDESYRYVRDKEAWPKTEAEMHELWRKRVKNDWLRLKLAGKDDLSIVEILDKRYDNSIKRLSRVKSVDAFQTYMNAYTMAIEPHTNFMGPRAAEDFGISMRLSLVGIGAVLVELDEYTTIRELTPGGPASLSGQLQSGDRIVGVAQGDDGLMTDILGWRLDDTVALIRGTADSVVRLDVLPADSGPDGKHKLVSLVRKTISLQEQAAKSSIHSIVDGNATRRIGVISLPSFYEDFAARQKGDRNYKSATRDVAHLLGELKKEKVDSVLIDLRNDGGGSLTEAVELTGLFIGSGPVVQQRNASGEISVESDTRTGVAWDGPLGVLINRSSASASEIFAAAIQDYGRGLIIGEPSFGKGTVQTMINLDQVAKNKKPQFGELKMTIAQFFRINGGTTQLRGVTPDILFPAASNAEDFGESSFENALPWTQVKAANYSPSGDLKSRLPILLTRHAARVKKDKEFQYVQEDIAESRLLRKKNMVSLNETERRKEWDAQEARLTSRESRRGTDKTTKEDAQGKELATGKGRAFRDDGLQAGERNLAKELAAEKERKNAKDVFLNEAINILGDEVDALKTSVKFVARVKPVSPLAPD
ncbi:MAG: carboxy terminal-processing peptidase [Rhodoferax sp.]|uniref:carboxy terminal-processing peptidase n=1 Tax=Rhodoferax sp. TaxID=50421 RepID=UPI001795E684|nr:carboxy terminal-processing peptidase [Rhodoferax sp.]NMM12475.1 carboxy terminal-processing peptidase [Rhodoferax sp.]NMM21822.1 carboxy terminal-processing peptidase [Rhodoferax sp.]